MGETGGGGATPELGLDLLGVEAETFAATPTLNLRIGLRRLDGGPVQCVLLTTTVTIAAARRGYDDGERERLAGVFGTPDMWDRSLHGLTWARVGATVPSFRGGTEVTLAVPCGHDMQVAADRYLHALGGGDVPLDLTFNGTVFYPGEDGRLRTGQIPWHHEATGVLPVQAWRDLMRRYYGTARWLRLDDDCFARLSAYRARRAHSSFDDTVDELLRRAERLRDEEEEEWTA
ncbi:DUF6084 family protein [Actinomadura madurae]|uniref:DUF6084 family protein n=1 Tax=Actinomadura madurae TaxID=1993 RepID=UPI00202757C8|nr:DUF6084 family protein [Actinomadura madurae]MCQ0005740.1 DUF6084 family protein [Actinomadura madurae]URM98971.1 DUF6084 family protein [Actinomadura madurae]